ncbi:MAG: restriction endonuclease subunit S, partial [Burkholderiales bacterium]
MKVELPRYQALHPTGWEWLTEIPVDWESLGLTRRIERIVDYRGATPEKVDDGIFLITAKNVRNGLIDYEISKEYVATETLAVVMRRGKPRLGDLLLTMEAPLGEVANMDREDVALAQRVVKIRPKPKHFSPYFLKYWMMSVQFRQHIETHGTGSIAVGIKASKLHLLRVVQPPLPTQQAIVTFLD